MTSAAVFSAPYFTRQVAEWLPRATPEEKARFERVFSSLEAETEEKDVAQKPPPAPAPKSSGWTHVATKAAQRRVQSAALQRSAVPIGQSAAPAAKEEEASIPREHIQWSERASSAKQHSREIASLTKAKKEGNNVPPPAVQKSPNVSVYHSTYNMRQDYPELYSQAVESTKSQPVPNFNFISDWGDSLKRGNDPEWREKFMKSAYTAANNDTYPSFVTDFDATKERKYFEWMVTQKTYYGDLLPPEKKAEFERAFDEASLEKKREILEGLRQVTAVVKPDSIKSQSQAIHRPMTRTEDPVLLAMTSEMIKVKTMGLAPPIIHAEDLPPPGQRMPPDAFRGEVSLGSSLVRKPGMMKQRPASAAPGLSTQTLQLSGREDGAEASVRTRPASAAGWGSRSPGHPSGTIPETMRPLSAMAQRQAQQLNGQKISKDYLFGNNSTSERPKTMKIETFASKVPLKQVGASLLPNSSSYEESFGTPGLKRNEGGAQHQAVRYKETTCPMGAVNKHTAIAPFRSVYPVPECYVQTLPFPLPSDDITSDTIYRQDFYARDEADTLRSMRDAATTTSYSKKGTLKSEIPLGKYGFNTVRSLDWKSEYGGNYVPLKLDIQGDRQRAAALKIMTIGPTASTGAVTASHRKPKHSNLLVRPEVTAK
ncbi:hypothetical protein CEUSTIGMA_g3982.t1 [Chlamydomonas eustigma]|uniref:Uncharacterized protein n=1 Tax=Chlamydomonas eustigma TaxID=1157962 RepID=A0A250X0F8_9CHLO|nr:hypothetical protein CEUSTIGMA_g3982.t1 [Chlamydomonas eustigma]|eukprot:GAX76536.1 hypothetical protein CEUSTIGMA_g3982.t1 [Chlamydomonas eustigma]